MWSRFSIWLVSAAAVLALAGCASFTLQTQFSSESELVAKRGQPKKIWENADGTRTFEYSTQPYGETAWMYTIDPKGVIVEQLDALAHRNHNRVRSGMSVEEVQRTLGQHRSIQTYALSGEEVWDWNVSNDQPGVVRTFFNVHFIEGAVERTSYSYIYPMDSNFSFGFFHGFPHGSIGFGYPGFGYPFGHPYAHGFYGPWPYFW